MAWTIFGRGRSSDDDDMHGSGLNRRQWPIVARLVDEIGARGTLSAEQREQLKPLLQGALKNLRDAAAVRHLETFIMEGDNASLDLAAQALAPAYDNPWLLISKSL